MSRELVAVLAFAFGTAGCSNKPVPSPTAAPPSLVASPPPASPAPPTLSKATEPLPPCTRDARSLALEGSTPEQLESRSGLPATRESFRAGERQGEFYAPIENLYPSIEPKNHDVPLEEWTWKSDRCTLTVWFHRPQGAWLARPDIYWHEDIDF